jgi:hypothetical protein
VKRTSGQVNEIKDLKDAKEHQLLSIRKLDQSLFFLRRMHTDTPRFFNEDWIKYRHEVAPATLFLKDIPITLFPEKDAHRCPQVF